MQKNMNKKATKIVLALLGVAVLALGIIWATGGFAAKADGHITVVVKDLGDKLLAEKKIGYKTGDKLTDLVKNNFKNVTYKEDQYGLLIMTIESITTPEDWSTWIAILINGELAQVGISSLEFKDGDTISFVNTQLIPQ